VTVTEVVSQEIQGKEIGKRGGGERKRKSSAFLQDYTLHRKRLDIGVFLYLKLTAQRNETETKQFQNCFETVLKLFCFSFISLCGLFKNKCQRVINGHYSFSDATGYF